MPKDCVAKLLFHQAAKYTRRIKPRIGPYMSQQGPGTPSFEVQRLHYLRGFFVDSIEVACNLCASVSKVYVKPFCEQTVSDWIQRESPFLYLQDQARQEEYYFEGQYFRCQRRSRVLQQFYRSYPAAATVLAKRGPRASTHRYPARFHCSKSIPKLNICWSRHCASICACWRASPGASAIENSWYKYHVHRDVKVMQWVEEQFLGQKC
jgi:hypothetical protein